MCYHVHALLPLDKELHSNGLALCPGPPLASGVDHNAFFSKPATKALFQQYVSAITRTNTITGRANRDDPTIMWVMHACTSRAEDSLHRKPPAHSAQPERQKGAYHWRSTGEQAPLEAWQLTYLCCCGRSQLCA